MNHFTLRLFFAITIFIIAYFTFKKLVLFIIPLLFSILFAVFLHPFVSLLDRTWKVGRTFNICIVIVLFFITAFSSTYFLFFALFHELEQFIQATPWNIDTILANIQSKHFFPFTFLDTLPSMDVLLEKLLIEIDQNSMQLSSSLIEMMKNILQSFTNMVMIIFFILFTTFFLLKDYVLITRFFKKLIPNKWMSYFYHIHHQFKFSLLHLWKAQFLLVCITAIIIFIFLIVFSFEHVWTITWVVFVIDFIPYIGIGILFIPWIIYSFLMEQYVTTIQLSSLYILLIIIRQVLEPKLYARSIGLHPLIVFFTLFFMMQQFGILGIICTPFMLMIISVLYYTRVLQLIWHYIKYGTSTPP